MKTLLILLLLTTTAYAQEHTTPNNFYEHSGVMKGAVPGFAKKPVYFKASIAEEQLRFLYNNKDVRLIISLDHCNDVRKVITKINSQYPGVALVHVCRKIRRGKSQYDDNIQLFEEIASYIGEVNFFIHCRYGAHRAVTALTGAWIAKQNLSFPKAFSNAGGKLRNFRRKGPKQLLQHTKKYAKDLIEIE